MSVVIRFIEENGVPYRITEDVDTGLFIQEGISVPPPEPVEPKPDRLALLEQENINLMLALTQIYEEKESEKAAAEEESINNMLAITELYEMVLALQGGSE